MNWSILSFLLWSSKMRRRRESLPRVGSVSAEQLEEMLRNKQQPVNPNSIRSQGSTTADKELTNGQQTVNKRATNGKQTGSTTINKRLTNGKQELSSEVANGKQTGSTTINKRLTND